MVNFIEESENIKVEDWMRQIPELSRGKTRRRVYAFLYALQNKYDNLYMSLRYMEKILDIPESNISRAVKELEQYGLLSIQHGRSRFNKNGPETTNIYNVIIPDYIKKEEAQMRETLEDALNYQMRSNNIELINYVKSISDKVPESTQELMINWLSDPLKDGSYINDTVGRFKLKLNELIKFCSYNGNINWDKFNSHIERAYKCAGVKLLYDNDISEEDAQKKKIIGL